MPNNHPDIPASIQPLLDAAEEQGWNYSIWEQNNGLTPQFIFEFEAYSPLGEDFLFSVFLNKDAKNPASDFIAALRKAYADFDPDEHAGMWISAKSSERAGQLGISQLSAMDLALDALEIEKMIDQLADSVYEVYRSDEYKSSIAGQIPKTRYIWNAEDYGNQYIESCDYNYDLDLDNDDEYQLALERANDDRINDFNEEVSDLDIFLSRSGNAMTHSASSEHHGNRLLVHGSIERWNGTSSVYATFNDLCSLLTPDSNSPFQDCEFDSIYDQNGHLFVSGHHHDGDVVVEVKQLTDKGEEMFDEEESTFSDIEQIWSNDDLSLSPRYMEMAFGCPGVEFEDIPSSTEKSKSLTVNDKQAEIAAGRVPSANETPESQQHHSKEAR